MRSCCPRPAITTHRPHDSGPSASTAAGLRPVPAGMNTRARCASRVRDRRVQWPGHACMRSDLEVDVAKEALNPVHEPAVARLVVTAAVHLIHGHDQVDDATSVPASCTHDRSALSSRTCGRKSHGRKSRHQALGRTLWGPHALPDRIWNCCWSLSHVCVRVDRRAPTPARDRACGEASVGMQNRGAG